MLILNYLNTLGRYLILMGRSFSRPERMRMFFKRYVKEMSQLGVDSVGIVLLISFFIGAVICIQMKLNIQSPWMPRWVSGYTTRESMLLEFSSSIMCKLCLLLNTAQDIRPSYHYALLGDIQFGNGYSGSLRHRLHWAHSYARRPHAWHTTCIQSMVYVDEYR